MVWDAIIAIYLFLAGLGAGAFVLGALTNWAKSPAPTMKKIAFIVAPVAVAVGLSMLRVLTGISILWLLLPGYAVALGISFFVPKIYTAIAFDSGGVASGPMTTAFLLPLAQGACAALGGNIVTDAFGVVAMVAMTPPITIQIMGLVSRFAEKNAKAAARASAGTYDALDADMIIEL